MKLGMRMWLRSEREDRQTMRMKVRVWERVQDRVKERVMGCRRANTQG